MAVETKIHNPRYRAYCHAHGHKTRAEQDKHDESIGGKKMCGYVCFIAAAIRMASETPDGGVRLNGPLWSHGGKRVYDQDAFTAFIEKNKELILVSSRTTTRDQK